MQQISLHIEYLLRTHDCVILPGIGAFLRTVQSASTLGDNTLCAASMQVCFNSSIVASDGLLAHSVARRQRISFEQASVIVSDACEQCRAALKRDGELAMGRLGLLSVDEENCISFRPYPSLYSHLWRNIVPGASLSNAFNININKEKVCDPSAGEKYFVLRISRRAVRYVAMAAVCLLTAATLLLPSANRTSFDASAPKQYASVIPGVEKIASAVNGLTEPSEKTTTDSFEKSSLSISNTQTTDSTLSQDNDRFYLIVATFKTTAECDKFIATQPDSDSLQIVSTGKVSRVYTASSDNQESLLVTMKSALHKSMHPQAWIWERPI